MNVEIVLDPCYKTLNLSQYTIIHCLFVTIMVTTKRSHLNCIHPPQNPITASSLHILYYNARNLLPKLDNFLVSTSILNSHIICIVETWLSSEIRNSEIDIHGFQLYRHDRNRHGDGVLIYVSAMFFLYQSPAPPLELLTLSIQYVSFKVHLSLFYRPPNS